MRLLERWLEEFSPSQRILDLGCGPGSLPSQLAGLKVYGADVDAKALARNTSMPSACAESHLLPFAGRSFDLVICNHSLEHCPDTPGTIREIRRVLKSDGRLFVTVPDGGSFSDFLYRLLFCGGGHVQRFSFEGMVGDVESDAGLHLAGWRELFSSFIYLDKLNFVPAPRGRLPGPFARRMRWVGLLPAWCFAGTRIFLNLATRWTDRCFSTRFSRYGWAFAFVPEHVPVKEEPGNQNVCMYCGAGLDGEPSERIAKLFYRCSHCSGANYLFH